MKKFYQLVFLAGISMPLFSIGQTLQVNQNDLTITRSDKPITKTIHISLKGNDPSKSGILTITETNSGTATRNIDYSITGPLKKPITDTATVKITILPDNGQKQDLTIPLVFSAKIIDEKTNEAIADEKIDDVKANVIIKPSITPPKAPGRQLYDIDSARLTILTAGSLSFFGSQQFAKYVGQLDIRLPSLLGKNLRWGFNAGVFTKNYNVDSVSVNPQIGHFNVRIPKDSLRYAQKAYRRYANKVEYNVVGAYFNPTFLLARNKDNSKESFRFYIDASLEFLATTIKSTYNNYTLIDSIGKPYNNQVSIGSALPPNSQQITPANSTVNQHIITGYYGFGPQLIYQKNNLIALNILFLSGYSVTGIENDSNVPVNTFNNGPAGTHQFYYFAKGVITEKVTKLNATIGVEVRGFYPNNTGVAAYLGFLISPSDFFKKN